MPLAALPAFFVLAVLFGGALVGIAMTSLRPGAATAAGFGLAAWRGLAGDDEFAAALRFTTWITLASTVISVVVGVGLALAFRNARRWARGLLAAPIAVPHLVVAVAAAGWLAPGGLAERIVGSAGGLQVGDRLGLSVIAVYVFKEAPFLALLLLVTWDRSTGDLEEAAATLGAGPVRRLRDVVAPRVLPVLGAGALVVSAFVIGATEVPLVVGPTTPDTLGTYALTVVSIDGPQARAQAAAALSVATALAFAVAVVMVVARRRRYR